MIPVPPPSARSLRGWDRGRQSGTRSPSPPRSALPSRAPFPHSPSVPGHRDSGTREQQDTGTREQQDTGIFAPGRAGGAAGGGAGAERAARTRRARPRGGGTCGQGGTPTPAGTQGAAPKPAGDPWN